MYIKIIPAILLFMMMLFAVPAAHADDDEQAATPSHVSALVETAPVKQGKIEENVTAYGIVQPDSNHAHTVAMPHDGIIAHVFVRQGQIVKAGDQLVEIENSPVATTQFDQAAAAVKFARNDLARQQRLFKEQLATRDQVGQAKKALSDAEAQYAQMQKTGMSEKNNTLLSPFDGVVTSLAAAAGAHLQADAVLLTIGNKDAFVVALGFEPEDASHVTSGMAVHLSSPLDPAINIDAKISAVYGMADPATNLVDALVQLSAPDTTGLALGMTLKGTIALTSFEGAIVPHAAIMRDTKGAYLFTVRNGKAHKMYVTVNYDNDTDAELKDAIAAGTPVVVSGNVALEDGMDVHEGGKATAGDKK